MEYITFEINDKICTYKLLTNTIIRFEKNDVRFMDSNGVTHVIESHFLVAIY